MGVSHTILKCPPLELSVDVDEIDDVRTYSISMGNGFTTGNQASVNIETPRLTTTEFIAVIGKMQNLVKSKNE